MTMRFGIVPLEFMPAIDRIVVNGVPDFSRFDIVDIVRDAVGMEHINVIEISMDIEHIVPGALTPDVIDRLVDLKDELKHSYSVHLPLWSIEPASFNEFARRAAVDTTVSSIKLAKPLEPEAYVFHSTGSLAAEFSRLDLSKDMVAMVCGYMSIFSAKSVEEVLTKSELDPKRFAIENIEFPFSITREIVDEYDTGICFDTGHALTHYSGDESVIEFYRAHKDRIIEFHLHDGIYEEREGVVLHDDHIALGTGEMPIRNLLMEVVKDKFNGPAIFELTSAETVESLRKIKEVVPEALE